MFGSLGVPELIFIFALALLIFGPRKLPEIGRTIGRGLSEFRKASTDLKRSINTEMIEEEIRQSDPRAVLDEPPSGGTSDEPASGGTSDEPPSGGTSDEPASGGTSDEPASGGTSRDDPPAVSPEVQSDDAASGPPPATEPAGGAAPRGSVPRSASGGAIAGVAPADSEAP